MIVMLSLGLRLFLRTNFLTQLLSRKIQRGFFVIRSVGISVFMGESNPAISSVIGVPIPFLRDEPPKTSLGKKFRPHERIFRLPCLLAAGVIVIVRVSINFKIPF